MAAATVAVAAVAATAAATAYSASQSGKGGPDSLAQAGYIGPGPAERLFNRGTRDILDTERSILDDALAQGKAVEPEMYRALGLEPVYDRPEDPDIGNLSSALSGKQQQLAQLQQQRALLQSGKANGGMKAGPKRAKAVAKINKQAALLNKEIGSMSTNLEKRTAVGRRVVGFKPLAGIADPTGSANNAFGGALDEFNAHLGQALAGKEPLDPTLKSAFDERERTLRERLRRQMGPDYETSTAGANALANFDREKSEAFAQYNTEAIGYYSGLAEHRAGALADLTSGRLKNLAFPATFRSTLATQLEGAANARSNYASIGQEERAGQGRAQARIAEANAQAQAERTAAITQLIGSVGAGAGAASPAIGAYTSGAGSSLSSALYGESVSPEAGSVGPPTQGVAGVGGSLGGGKLQNLLGRA
jgi:hypothetical protein